MITFKNINTNEPFIKFKEKYDEALSLGQPNVEAISIASFSSKKNEVDSRFVNLKFVDNENFIFFTNYDSPKSSQFKSHNQISAIIFWSKINVQIRIKAKIVKVSKDYSMKYLLMIL